MFRNKEFRVFLYILCFIGIGATSFAALAISTIAAILVFITCFLLISAHVIYTSWRYREMEKLSHLFRRIQNGNYNLDVRDHYEGELSILKTEIYKVTQMLSKHGSRLQEDQTKLTNAISDISHQLKTPLTSMMVMADLLSEPDLETDKREEFTENIQHQLERIEWLVSSLLKLAKIDAGTVQFKKQTIFVQEILENALDPVSIQMEVKQQTVTISGDKDVSFTADRRWTTEALINILKNCVEHTDEGGSLSITYRKNPLFTEITIQDSGKGISKKDLPYIFKRFYKGENASEDSVGIGLAMAYSIITSQNGDIEVSSQLGIGTTFQIKFYH